MNEVTRYNYSISGIKEHHNGEYVLHSDYELIAQDNKRLRDAILKVSYEAEELEGKIREASHSACTLISELARNVEDIV